MKILVVRTDKLGDFITALPTLSVLKKYNPANSLSVCVAPLNRELASSCPFIDEVIVDDGETPVMEFASMLQKKKFDASITLFSNTRVALYQAIAQIPIRIAPATKIAQIFYNRRIKQRRSEAKMAEFEYNLYLCKALFEDIDLTYDFPLIEFSEAELTEVYDTFYAPLQIDKPIIAFHPGSGGSSEANLTFDEYLELVNIVIKSDKYQAVMTFGPDDTKLFQKAQKECEGLDVILYNSKDGIVNFLKLLSTLELFVSTSTGTYHLAALAGIRTLSFFGSSTFASVKRWRAISPEEMQKAFMLDAKNKKSELEKIKEYLHTYTLEERKES